MTVGTQFAHCCPVYTYPAPLWTQPVSSFFKNKKGKEVEKYGMEKPTIPDKVERYRKQQLKSPNVFVGCQSRKDFFGDVYHSS